MSALLGVTSKGAHNYAKKTLASEIPHLKNMSRVPLVVKDTKLVRNILGTGAVGAGLGSAILATKYLKNKKRV